MKCYGDKDTVNDVIEDYLAEYCANKECTDKNGSECDLCMWKKGVNDCIELIKSRSDDDKLMNDYYVDLLEQLKERDT